MAEYPKELAAKALSARRVQVESPFAGGADWAHAYLNECLKDCVDRGETPYASHALLTRPGVLNDHDPDERLLGVLLGFAMRQAMHATVVYTDHGISPGMQQGIDHAVALGHSIEYRILRHTK